MTSRMLTHALKSQLTRAKAAFGSSSRTWMAPGLLTVGLLAQSSRDDSPDGFQGRTSWSERLTSVTDPVFAVKVTSMEKQQVEYQSEEHEDTDAKNPKDTAHGGEARGDGEESSTTETPKKEEALDKSGTTNNDDDDETNGTEEGVEVGGSEKPEVKEEEGKGSVETTENDDDGDEDDDDDEDEEEDDEDEEEEEEPPKPLYEPVKDVPENLSKENLWDNFNMKAVRMTDEEFEDESKQFAIADDSPKLMVDAA